MNEQLDVAAKLLECLKNVNTHLVVEGAPGKETHSARSREWIVALGKELETRFDGDCYSRRCRGEFLFDIVVTGPTGDTRQEGPVFFGRRLWAVESEFSNRRNQVDRDLAKLTWAAADNRLMVVSDSEEMKKHLDDRANRIRLEHGTLFAARFPHPRDWAKGRTGQLLRFENRGWKCVGVF